MARKPSPLSAAFGRRDAERAALAGPVTVPVVEPKPTKVAKVRGIFLGGYVDETTKRQFKVLLAERGLTEQAALEEMLNDFFSKYGKHRLAGTQPENVG